MIYKLDSCKNTSQTLVKVLLNLILTIFYTCSATPVITSRTEDIADLAKLVLTNNNLVFNGKHYLQTRGTAIGPKMAPSYANIFMDKLEREILDGSPAKPHVWWRYIDDIIMIWTEGEERLVSFLEYMNTVHPTIKFTSEKSYHSVNFP